ncbi:hypothetical protein C1645_781136 [Glomus cerebriforme]|uniref:Uncharacterized protein n=1 Tax=Glomus cerebriforme TaxID=658196 RepID=A0A397S4F6_9GLOM|nr:hypothetical protein C1645_791624 [Glomus cerebriforme]RIA85794.1 hypothetical protein C1645_781136 [Glomus cerebriforme]
MKIANLKEDIGKKWSRIIATKYTICFVLVSIAQALVLIYLQVRMLERNGNSLLRIYKLNETDQSNDNCFNGQFLPLYVLTLENLMFIFFYFFQLYFCFNAIFHQNTIQIITIALINFAFVFIGMMQVYEVRSISIALKEDCPGFEFEPDMNEMFFILALAILVIFMGYLSFKLHRQFGWNIYKKIGGDVAIQNLLIMILFAGLLIPVFYILYQDRSGVEKFFIFVSTAMMISVFFFEILAYKSLNDEWSGGMLMFICFWIFALLNFAGLCVVVINLSIETKWYIGFIIGIICFTFSLSTLIYAVFAYRNFGGGLKEYINKNKDRQEVTKVLLSDV